jgi:uncharacterized protein Smg (DUF494 family)
MQDKVVELIIRILNEITSQKIQLQEVNVKDLEKLGYSMADMKVAFSWLFDKLCLNDFRPIPKSEKNHSLRVLHDIEKMVVSPEAYGYLIQLRELNIVTDSEIESIIENIMVSHSNLILLDEMKVIVSSFIFETDESISQRLSSYDDETIN